MHPVPSFCADPAWWLRVPGKALLSGGYAIIFEDQPGLSLALDAFYFINVRRSSTKCKKQIRFALLNPQFPNSDFEVLVDSECKMQVEPVENKFVRAALKIFLRFCQIQQINYAFDYEITLLQTPNFFVESRDSQEFSIRSALVQNFTFLKYKKPLLDTAKNGFGSSSCLLLAVLSGLLYSLRPELLEQKALIYVLGLLANFEAQKKIGSGFDVGSLESVLTDSDLCVGVEQVPETVSGAPQADPFSIYASRREIRFFTRN